jgi:hypothetical protein
MQIFEVEMGKITQGLVEKGYLKEEYYKEQGKQADLLQAANLYRAFTRSFDNISPFFVASFCRHRLGSEEYNHGLLSQWRGYAEGGGFAIEFDEAVLDGYLKEEVKRFAYAGMKSDDVEYQDFRKVFEPSDYEGIAGEMVWQIFDELGKDVSAITGRADVDKAVMKFAHAAPFLKHRGFYEEAEYRIVMTCLRRNKVPNMEKREVKNIKFRSRGSSIIPYIELFDLVGDRLPVKSIIVGPHPNQQTQIEAVRMVLEQERVDVPIRSSEIPYRA